MRDALAQNWYKFTEIKYCVVWTSNYYGLDIDTEYCEIKMTKPSYFEVLRPQYFIADYFDDS